MEYFDYAQIQFNVQQEAELCQKLMHKLHDPYETLIASRIHKCK